MKRRTFIKNAAIAMSAAVTVPELLSATENKAALQTEGGDGSDFKIVSDEVRDNVRYVTATPSSMVCSSRIDIEIDLATQTIRNCRFTRGCPGNALGLCSVIKGMKTEDVIARLLGTPCGKKSTSCPDQLARILSSLR